MRLTFDGGDHNGDNDKDRVITGTRARHTAIRLNGSLWCLIIYLAQFLVSLQPAAGQLYGEDSAEWKHFNVLDRRRRFRCDFRVEVIGSK